MTTCPKCGSGAYLEDYISRKPGQPAERVVQSRCYLYRRLPAGAIGQERIKGACGRVTEISREAIGGEDMPKQRARHKYTDEEKREVVKQAEEYGVVQVARQRGIHRTTIYGWRDRFRELDRLPLQELVLQRHPERPGVIVATRDCEVSDEHADFVRAQAEKLVDHPAPQHSQRDKAPMARVLEVVRHITVGEIEQLPEDEGRQLLALVGITGGAWPKRKQVAA